MSFHNKTMKSLWEENVHVYDERVYQLWSEKTHSF